MEAIATNTRVPRNSANPAPAPTASATPTPVVRCGGGISSRAAIPMAPSTKGISCHTVTRPEEILHHATIWAMIPMTITAARTVNLLAGIESSRRSRR